MNRTPAHEALGLRFERLPGLAWAALACALAALWLLGRRYAGISHDATLYLGQGLRRLHPEAFAADLFFAYGAQDSYTLFPRLYAPLIDALGAGSAAMAVTVLGQLGFLAAALVLVNQAVRGPARWWSLALLAVSSGYYGGVGTFRIAEPFATARVLAEPLVVAALAATLASRPRSALVALLGAALLHPLVALPGVALIFTWHALQNRRGWLIVPPLALAGVVAALAWPDFLARFDSDWRNAVIERSPHIFVGEWQPPDWARFAWGVAVTALAAHFAHAPMRRLLAGSIGIGLAGVALSWLAVDIAGSVVAAALQLWRMHWLMHLLAILHVPVVALALWRHGCAGRAAAICMAASCAFGRAELPAAALLAGIAIALYAGERRSPGWMGGRALRAVALVAVCTAAVGLLFEVQTRMPLVYGALQAPGWTDYAQAAMTVGGLLPLAALLWVLAHTRFSYAALALSLVALTAAAMAWDARTPWRRFLEQESARDNPFRAVVAGRPVFWRESGGPAWLVLGAPSWFSVDQGAGIVFSRQTAIEYARRKEASRALRESLDDCSAACRLDPRPARSLCRLPGGPDYLVLTAPIEGIAAMEWQLPSPVGRNWSRLFLYACADVSENKKAGARPAFS
jgi:hypothetical protein